MLSLLQGDVLQRLRGIPSDAIQCVVTSPPYFGLRSYQIPDVVWDGDPECDHVWGEPGKPFHPGQVEQTKWKSAVGAGAGGNLTTGKFCLKCNAWLGCLGNEPTLQFYIQHLVDIFEEVKRVLRDDGVLFVNIGDSYASVGGDHSKYTNNQTNTGAKRVHAIGGGDKGVRRTPKGLKPKDLMLIPERLAIALQEAGWYVRSRIAWTKGSVLPESCKDRPTSSWEHIWMLTKSSKYYWDKTAGLEPLAASSVSQEEGTSGRNMRNVWHMNPKPLKEAHFATFPQSLPTKAIEVATSEAGCCPNCRAPYKRVVEKGLPDEEHKALCGADSKGEYNGTAQKDYAPAKAQNPSATKARILAGMVKKITTGWTPTCDCPPSDPIPCLVLDPFSGAGTTILAARDLGRDAVGIELNPDYIEITEKRLETEVWDQWMW